VQDWAICHEEQIPRLAAALIQGLALWPYILDIIDHVASTAHIRDALLRESPGLLSHLLEKATTTSADVALTTTICISFLSVPLPKGLPLPAAAQTFLSQLFENAMKRPSITTIEPVYALLDGACADLLELLPQASLDQLRDQLTQLMRTAKKIEEQPLSLYCLAIIAKLNKFHHVVGEHGGRRSSVRFTPSSQSRDTSAHSWEEVQKFFQGERALKTIHLLVLQVIYACRPESKDSDQPPMKHVRIAREVLSAIDSLVREKWLQSNGAITKKLHEKAASNTLPNLLRLEAIAFTAMFKIASDHGSTTSTILLEKLVDLSAWRLQDRQTRAALSVALIHAAPKMDMRFWTAMLAQFCHVSSARGKLCEKQNAVSLLVELSQVLRNDDSACKGLTTSLESEVVRRSLQSVFVQTEEVKQFGSSENNYNVMLTVEMCGLLLDGARSSKNDHSTACYQVALQALTKLKQLARVARISRTPAPWQMAAVSLMEQKCTPEEQGASHNWQQRLAIELNFDSTHRQESITRLIGQICRDLHERCDNVEQPLRAQQAKYDELKTEYAKLQARAQEVQNQLVCQASETEALQRSKEQVQEDLEAALAECDTIMQEKNDLEETMQRTRDSDAQKYETMRRELDSRNLELRTILACNEERKDEQDQEIARLRRQLSQMEEQRREDNERSSQEKQALENTIQQLRSQHQQSEAIIADQATQISDLERHNNDLQATITNQETQMADIQAQTDQQLTAATAANDALTRTLDTLRTEHDHATASAQETLSVVQREMGGKLDSAHIQLDELRAQSAEEIHSKDAIIADLQRKAQKYLEQAHKKTSQLEEAQRMKGRLLMAMGLDNGQGQSDSRATQEQPTGGRKRRSSRRERASLVPPHRTEHDEDMTDDILLDDSLAVHQTQHEHDDEQDSDSRFSDSPIPSLANTEPTKIASQHRHARAAAFKIPTMRPTVGEVQKTIRSPPRRRQSTAVPLSDASAEFVNRDLARGSPRRKTAGFVSAREVKWGMMEAGLGGSGKRDGEREVRWRIDKEGGGEVFD